jgi:hypothetical protein
MKYWCLVLDNYEEEDSVIYFDSFETAKANFLSLAKKHEDFDEFEMEADEENKVFACTWFDPSYNEWSTYASLHEREMPCVYSGLIF